MMIRLCVMKPDVLGGSYRFLEASDHSRWSAVTVNDVEIGPDAELLFWKRRLQKLSAITEQVLLVSHSHLR